MNKNTALLFFLRSLFVTGLFLGLLDCTAPSVTVQSPWHSVEYHPWGVTDSAICDCGNEICRCPGIFHSIYVGDAPPNPRLNYFYVSCIGAAPPPGAFPTVGYLRERCPNLRPTD